MPDNISSQLANAFVLLELGNLKATADTLEGLMDAIASETAGRNAPDMATIATICSKLIHSGGTMEIRFFTKLCSTTTQCFGGEHPMSLSAELQLASALLIQGHQDSAEKTAAKLLDKCEQILGKDHPLTVQCALLLVGAYSRREDIVSGQTLMARIPTLRDALLGGLLGGQ